MGITHPHRPFDLVVGQVHVVLAGTVVHAPDRRGAVELKNDLHKSGIC